MGLVVIDGNEIEVADHERLNGIQAARRVGVEIPHYCWHPGLSVVASCRMCLVETGTRAADGKISMLPKLVPACQTPARTARYSSPIVRRCGRRGRWSKRIC
jgi:NADH-quinone oxidoreductase subunit G